MESHSILANSLIFLAAAVVTVSLFRRFGLATVLGYLAAGSAIGPFGLRLIPDASVVMGLAELGVVLLLFIIGLELQPSRLWLMRKPIFGLGGAQVLLSTVLLAGGAWSLGLDPLSACVIGFSLALSSTAFALQILSERKEMLTEHGRASFAILLFQDLAAIPMLAILPFLSPRQDMSVGSLWGQVFKVLLTIGLIIFGGRYIVRPFFSAVAAVRAREVFTAATLLLVLGVAYVMESIGVSMALGAFLAGVLLADSEFRHELEADIEPFKGLLLGLFFISVGIAVDYSLVARQPLQVASIVLGFMAGKALVIFLVARVFQHGSLESTSIASVLPQGGEFAFVIFGAAVSHGVLEKSVASLMTVSVTLSMILTPFVVSMSSRFLEKRRSRKKTNYDVIESEQNQVIIAGFGRVGQISGRLLRVLGIGFTALEHDLNQVEVLRKFGQKVYYGDASRLDLLEAAGAKQAKLLVLAIDDMQSSLRTAEAVSRHFPHLKIIARARNREHAFKLIDIGVTSLFRETFASSLELSEALLKEIGYSASQARDVVQKFREQDELMLQEQHAIHRDEEKYVEYSKQASAQLSDLFRTDKPS